MADSYYVEYKCKNCKSKNFLHIKKGVEVESYLESEEIFCENCEVRLK